MVKAKLRFTERDVSRAVRAVTKAGLEVGRVVVETSGSIIVVTAQQTNNGDLSPTPFDQWKAKHAHQA